jgi:putative DNA primase/helicase
MIYANKIALALPGSKIIKLPDLSKGGDVYDWLRQGRTMAEIDEFPTIEPEMPEPEISINNIPHFLEINPFESTENKQRYRWEDIGTANLFADAYKNICRYCPEAKSWYIYDGRVWRIDVGGVVTAQCGKALTYYMLDCRKYLNDDEQRESWIKYVAKRIQKKSRDIMLADAATVYPISIHEFDKDPYLFNVQNGTLDLRTFTLRPHNPDDFLSKIANVIFDKNARCERWERFIQEIMQDDGDKAQFLQKALGYALTGDTSEECFFIFYGNTTRNGKGTTAETTLHILGDYGRTAQPETIAQKQNSSGGAPSEDVARLKGARFVNMSEPEKGLRLNSALVKSMTGGDTITARFLHQNSFEFRPEYKLYINTNHLPRVNDDSIFASGRVKLIPFERHFPENEQDKGLKAFFRQPENKSGIFNWLLAGLKILKSDGLKQPQSVRDATAQYRADSDVIGQFISECLAETRNMNTPLKNIHARYEEWCNDYGHRPLNSHNLATELRRKGKQVKNGAKNKIYLFDHSILSDREDCPPEWEE